jgi:uncharacterized membrane protein
MWVGIGLVLFIGIFTLLDPWEPDYGLFLFWTLAVISIVVGLINTLRIKTKGSNKMNLKKGFRRLVFVISLLPVLIGIILLIGGLIDEDEELIGAGLLVAFIGFVAVWTIYGIILYIVKGFKESYCANCEEDIGKLEKTYSFKGHIVCEECHNKLSGNQSEIA